MDIKRNIKRNDVYLAALLLGAYTTAGNIPASPGPCCHEETHEPERGVEREAEREDGSTDVATLDICEKQKVTGVVYTEGQPPVYVKLVWDGDSPRFKKDDVHRFINGWETIVE